MSLLIKALKQAELRHQEALVLAAADAAAAVAVVEAAGGTTAPAAVPLALEPASPDPAPHAASPTPSSTLATPATDSPTPAAGLFDDASRALPSHEPIALSPLAEATDSVRTPSPQESTAAALAAQPHADLAVPSSAVPAPAPEPAVPAVSADSVGRLNLFPARMEAPAPTGPEPVPAVPPASIAARAAPVGGAPEAAAAARDPKAVERTAGSTAGARRPSSRMIVGGALALAVCGVGSWLALEVSGVPSSNRAGAGNPSSTAAEPGAVGLLPPMPGSSEPVPTASGATTLTASGATAGAAPGATAATPAGDPSLQMLAPFVPAAKGTSSAVRAPAAVPDTPPATPARAQAAIADAPPVPAARVPATPMRAARPPAAPAAPAAAVQSPTASAAVVRAPAGSSAEPVAAVVRTPVPRATAARGTAPVSAALAGLPDRVDTPSPVDRTAPAAGDVRFFRANAQAEQIAALLQTAWTAAASQRTAEARRAYDEVLRLDRNNVDAWIGVATIAAREGESANAERAFRRVLDIDPNDSTARAGLVTLLGTSDAVAQESNYRNLLARDTSDPALHYALGNSLAAQGRWAEAQQAFFNAVAGDSGQPEYLHNLAVSLERLRQPQAALNYYRKALAAAASRPAAFDVQTIRARIEVLEGALPRAPAAAAAPAIRFTATAQIPATAEDAALEAQ
jgi:Tfp pilus assembly protein PilF